MTRVNTSAGHRLQGTTWPIERVPWPVGQGLLEPGGGVSAVGSGNDRCREDTVQPFEGTIHCAAPVGCAALLLGCFLGCVRVEKI